MSLIQQLNERAPLEFSKFADVIVSHIIAGVPVEEMRSGRGKNYDDTLFYQIRVKPTGKDLALKDILRLIEKHLKSAASKKMGFTEVQVNEKSRNSGKFSSVSFNYGKKDYDIVVALGGNKGEDFEKDLLLKMDNLVAGIEDSKEAEAAFKALAELDPAFKMSNIKGVSARTGSTQRSGDMSPEETGKIIADIIIDLKKGGKKYISLKNSSGATVANFGVSKAFTQDMKINTQSVEWKSWIAPFGLDVAKIEQGLHAYDSKSAVDFEDTEHINKKITKTSPIFKLLQKLWGADYYYLREKGSSFQAMKIDRDYVDNHLLKNLTVSEIRYPCAARKQISIYMHSATKKFKIELRNSQGKTRPTEIKFGIMGDVK